MEDESAPHGVFEPIEPIGTGWPASPPTGHAVPPPLPNGSVPPPPLPPPPPGPGWWLASDGNWYPPSAPPAPAKANGLAIASLVLGIVWIYWIGSVLALVFGYMGKRRIDESGGRETGRGLAVAGIVLGWIGVAAFVLFMGLVVLIGVAGTGSESRFEDVGTAIGGATTDVELQQLVDSCRSGDMADCDELYWVSDYGSWQEAVAMSCGGRSEFDLEGECELRFG